MRKYSARHFPARSAVTLFQTDNGVSRKLCARLLQSQVSLVRFEVFKRGRLRSSFAPAADKLSQLSGPPKGADAAGMPIPFRSPP